MMPHPTIFMSHAHADSELCRSYVAALRVRGFDVWYDESNLQAGHSLTQDIERELQARKVFLVMLTPASTASYWVRLETGAFRALMATDSTRLLLPVHLLPCDIPLLLRDTKWIEAVGKPFDAVIAEIAAALRPPTTPRAISPQVPPPLPQPVVNPQPTDQLTRAPEKELGRARCQQGFLIVTTNAVKIELRAPIGSRLMRSQTMLISAITHIETKVVVAAVLGHAGGMNIVVHSSNGSELRATVVTPLKQARVLAELLETLIAPH